MTELPTGTVTFLFTDIEGSTNLARTLGDRWLGVLEQHHGILRMAIREAGGIVIRTEGDAFFAVLALAVDAIAACAEAQRRLAAYRWPDEGAVRVRMGMHTGEGRLVPLTGPGGTGKTRLALEAASGVLDRFPHGVFFVDLAPITDPALVPSAILTAVGSRGGAGPRSELERLQIELRDRAILLVLDNFEQVIHAAAAVGVILATAQGIRVLATSRSA